MRRKGLVLAGLLVGIVILYVNSQKPAPSISARTEDRRPMLKELVARQEKESAQAVASRPGRMPSGGRRRNWTHWLHCGGHGWHHMRRGRRGVWASLAD